GVVGALLQDVEDLLVGERRVDGQDQRCYSGGDRRRERGAVDVAVPASIQRGENIRAGRGKGQPGPVVREDGQMVALIGGTDRDRVIARAGIVGRRDGAVHGGRKDQG